MFTESGVRGSTPVEDMETKDVMLHLVEEAMLDETGNLHGGFEGGIATCLYCKKHMAWTGEWAYSPENLFPEHKHEIFLIGFAHEGCNSEKHTDSRCLACPKTKKPLM